MVAWAARPNDTSYIDEIPKMINLAQAEVSAFLNIVGELQTVSGVLLPEVNVIQKPQLWARTNLFTYQNPDNDGEYSEMKPRTQSYCQKFMVTDTWTGYPLWYADLYQYDTYLISPTPQRLVNSTDIGYPYQLKYHTIYEPLSLEHQQNWMTQRIPTILIKACMVQAQFFLQNPLLEKSYRSELYEMMKVIKENDQLGKIDSTYDYKVS